MLIVLDRIMTLQHKLQGCLRAQGHERTDPLFVGVNAVVLEHFTIGLLSELRQQVRYEQVATFDEAVAVAEKEANMEEVLRPTVQTMVKTVQFSTEPEVRKHPEVNSRMESATEQMINQMNQLSLHLLQPRTNKNRNRRGTYQLFNVTNVERWDIIQKNVQTRQPWLLKRMQVFLLEGFL